MPDMPAILDECNSFVAEKIAAEELSDEETVSVYLSLSQTLIDMANTIKKDQ